MLLIIILCLLLLGNWFFTTTLVYTPVNLLTHFTIFSWWGISLIGLVFLAWCIGDD